MKRFAFSLETLLEVRRRKEDSLKLELARRRAAVNRAQSELAALTQELQKLQEDQKAQRAKTITVMLLRFAVAYRHKLRQDMLAKGREIDTLAAEAERTRRSLVKATQQTRVIELLKEKRFAEWQKQYRLEEQKFIDDVSQQGYIRKKRLAASHATAA